MIAKEDLVAWLNDLPDGTMVGIDEGGLTIRADYEESPVYYEVGGLPEEERTDYDD